MSARAWAVIGLCLVAGCSGGKDEKGPPGSEAAGAPAARGAEGGHEDEHAHEELPRRVRLSPEVIAAAKIRTAKVGREALAVALSLPGEVTADPDRLARVAAPVDGRIERVSLKEGAAVKKGDVLAVIRVPELGKVRGALAGAQAKAKAARANADRLRHLVEQKLAAAQEHENAEAEAAGYEAEARALAAELSAIGTGAGAGASLSLRAPIAGVVIARDAVLGQPVTPATVLATIADLSEVWFLGRVFEKDLGRLREGAPAEVELNAYPGERFQGQLEYLSKQVDPIARTLTARVRLSNPDAKLRLGLFGAARVATGEAEEHPPVLVVDRSAVTEIGGKPVVFVRHPDDDFELHELVLGGAALGKVEVLSGLREGEDVVTEGVFTLKSAVLKSAFAEEEE